jgi:CDGSH-type Zn-finger protein
MIRKPSQEELKPTPNHVSNLLRSVSEANVVALCTCQQSRDFPFCDNTHTIFNKATNANISPLYVAIVEGKCSDCGSKLKDKNGLSHSMDNHISDTCNTSRGCTLTLSDNATSLNILNNSTDTHSIACKCKANKLSVSTPAISFSQDKQFYTKSSRSSTPTDNNLTNTTTKFITTQTDTEITQTTTNIPQEPPEETFSTKTCNITTEEETPTTPTKGIIPFLILYHILLIHCSLFYIVYWSLVVLFSVYYLVSLYMSFSAACILFG